MLECVFYVQEMKIYENCLTHQNHKLGPSVVHVYFLSHLKQYINFLNTHDNNYHKASSTAIIIENLDIHKILFSHTLLKYCRAVRGSLPLKVGEFTCICWCLSCIKYIPVTLLTNIRPYIWSIYKRQVHNINKWINGYSG